MVVICLHLDKPFWQEESGTEMFLKDKNKDLQEHEDSKEIYP